MYCSDPCKFAAWMLKNVKRRAASKAQYKKDTAEKQVAWGHKYRALKMGADMGTVTEHTRQELLDAQQNTCFYCLTDLAKVVVHLDHVQPLTRGGAHCRTNLVAACGHCNVSKHAALLATWLERAGHTSRDLIHPLTGEVLYRVSSNA